MPWLPPRWDTAARCRAAVLALAAAGCTQPFAPHPGTVVFRSAGEPDRVKQAANVPDSIKWFMFDKAGRRVEAAAEAVRQVPVVLVERRGGPEDEHIFIIQYGPDGKPLQVTHMIRNPAR